MDAAYTRMFTVTRLSIIPKCTGYSLRYQVPKIFPLSSTAHILEGVAGKIYIHFSQFSEKNSIMLQKY